MQARKNANTPVYLRRMQFFWYFVDALSPPFWLRPPCRKSAFGPFWHTSWNWTSWSWPLACRRWTSTTSPPRRSPSGFSSLTRGAPWTWSASCPPTGLLSEVAQPCFKKILCEFSISIICWWKFENRVYKKTPLPCSVQGQRPLCTGFVVVNWCLNLNLLIRRP